MARRSWLAVLAVLAGCVEQRPLELPALAGARSALVVVRGLDGEAAAALELASSSTTALPVALDRSAGAEVLVFAWDVPLAALHLAPGPVPLAEPGACSRRIPPGARVSSRTVSAASEGGWADMTEDVASSVRLAPSPGACPRAAAFGATSVEVRCASTTCDAHLEVSSCAVKLDPGQCLVGELRGRFGANGDLCFEPSEILGACDERLPSTDGGLLLECGGAGPGSSCTIDVEPAPAPPALAFEKVRLADVPRFDDPDFGRPTAGYVTGFALLDDRLVVALRAGPYDLGCAARVPNTLVTLDPATLAVVRTATIAQCTAQLAPDPIGGGFLATFFTAEGIHLGRFTRDGVLEDSVLWDEPGPPIAPSSLLVHPGPPVRALVSLSAAADTPARLFGVDLERFAKLSYPASIGASVTSLRPYDATHVLAIDDSRRVVHFLDVATGAITDGPSTVGLAPGALVGEAVWLPGARRFLITLDQATGGLFAFEPGYTQTGRAFAYEQYAQIWSVDAWPADPRRAIAGLIGLDGDYTAWAALVDPAAPRLLPGSQALGHGPLVGYTADRQGRVYAVLPWAAELVRLRAAE